MPSPSEAMIIFLAVPCMLGLVTRSLDVASPLMLPLAVMVFY